MSHDLGPAALPPLSSLVATTTLDTMPYPVFVHRPDGTLEYINPVAAAFWGISSDTAVGNFNLFQQEGAIDAAQLAAFREVVAGGARILEPTAMDISKIKMPGEYSPKIAWVESSLFPLLAPDGRVAYVETIQRDVTELVEKRENLRQAGAEIAEQRELIARLETAQLEIAAQRVTIEELQSPVIEVWDGVLTMPILGVLTGERADAMLDRALTAVSAAGARHFILDLTGSEQVDTTTAGHILAIVRAVALLGAEAMIVGIRPNTAQTMVGLGLGLEQVCTYRNLREALRRCMKQARPE